MPTALSGSNSLSLGVVRSMIDDAASKGYGPGRLDASTALGIAASPSSIEPTAFEHAGRTVRVVPCVSALAVRSALLDRDPDEWLVIVTDRDETDLGVGILTHLAGNKLRTPNQWGAVQHQFAATGVEAALYADPQSRPLATALLKAQPAGGWPPAPAGVLTRDHALGSVAHHWLGTPRRSLDVLSILTWSADPQINGRIAELRSSVGNELTDATLGWIASNAGSARAPIAQLMRQGDISDALPLGLVLSLLAGASPDGAGRHDLGLARLAHRWGNDQPSLEALQSLAAAATQVTSDLLRERTRRDEAFSLLRSADTILTHADATEHAGRSPILPSGLTARLHEVAHRLRTALSTVADGNLPVDPSVITPHTAAIETAWRAVEAHRLADPDVNWRDDRLVPMSAAVRLSRWLATTAPSAEGLAELALRQARDDAWVDRAVNDAHLGSADPQVAEALTQVIVVVQRVRDSHDEQFARALAAATADGAGAADGFLPAEVDKVWLLEHLLPERVIPLAKETPTLLLVLDGMSTGVATEVVDDVVQRSGWQEARFSESTGRSAALAVLPSLTEVSRASLLSGKLTTGQQHQEQNGYRELLGAYALSGASLFHKKPLDTTQPGYAVADDVAHAIDDEQQQLVTCVLNTIDDALDRSDPAGTEWTADAVKHLRPLLDRALAAGRTVVLTADHGHVVERRQGTRRSRPDISSGRSRGSEAPVEDGEILVTGPRVLKHDGRAVLPYSERLRYGPLKAGYHGGASPAEVVVPVVVLIPGEDVPAGTGLELASVQSPAWWDLPPGTTQSAEAAPPTPVRRPHRTQAVQDSEPLFEIEQPKAAPSTSSPTRGVGAAVLAAAAYRDQRAVSGRVAITDEQVGLAVDALTAAPGTRLPSTALARALGLPPTRVRGAIAQLQQLLNVEGYPVLRAEGTTVILDEQLLREQFSIT